MSKLIMRLLDVVLSAFALVILSPLLLAVYAAVRISMGFPVLFRQERLGENGRIFTIYKFRSMLPGDATPADGDAVNGYAIKLKNDPRITRLGHWLRKTSIDELPQLLNVLRGDMSIVGPRPWVKAEYDRMPVDWRKRLASKPGITGLAQISGRSDLPPEDIISFDIAWNETLSLSLYLKIILLTPFRIFRGASSY